MPHETSWYLENHVVLVRMWDDLSADELKVWNDEILDFLNSSPAEKIHVIVDDSQLKRVSPNVTQITQLLSVVKHPKMGWEITVGPGNPIFNFFGTVLTRLGNIKHRRFKSVEEAIAMLAHENPMIENALKVSSEH